MAKRPAPSKSRPSSRSRTATPRRRPAAKPARVAKAGANGAYAAQVKAYQDA